MEMVAIRSKHFEMKGWEESEVVVCFRIIAMPLALLSLSTLKLT